MNVGAVASELSIKGFRRDSGRKSRQQKPPFLLSPLVASFAEIESSGGPQIEMEHLHFLHPARNDYVTPLRALFRAYSDVYVCIYIYILRAEM